MVVAVLLLIAAHAALLTLFSRARLPVSFFMAVVIGVVVLKYRWAKSRR